MYFAMHLKKGSKSGFMPAYHYDPYMYRLHRMKGGSLKTYKDTGKLIVDIK
jgi:hypothetical protein